MCNDLTVIVLSTTLYNILICLYGKLAIIRYPTALVFPNLQALALIGIFASVTPGGSAGRDLILVLRLHGESADPEHGNDCHLVKPSDC